MRYHQSKLPINRADLYSIEGGLLDYYDCSVIDQNEAIDYIKSHRLKKFNKFTYASLDMYDRVESIVCFRPKPVIIVNPTLNEAKRSQLISYSKRYTKDRFDNRRTISKSEITYNSIDRDKFLNSGVLSFNMTVRSYEVTIEIDGILDYLKKHINKVTFKEIRTYLNKAIDTLDIKIDCTCPDFRYRFAYTATIKGFKANSPENRPSNITNPNLRGSSCKHILHVLNNKQWIVKYISLINLYLKLNPDLLK